MRWALTSPTLFTSSILVTVHLVPIPSHVCRTHIPHVAWHVSRMWCANTRTRGTTPLGSASAKHRSLQASAHTANHGRQVIKLLSYLTVARNIYYPSSGSTPPFFPPLLLANHPWWFHRCMRTESHAITIKSFLYVDATELSAEYCIIALQKYPHWQSVANCFSFVVVSRSRMNSGRSVFVPGINLVVCYFEGICCQWEPFVLVGIVFYSATLQYWIYYS